jgi:hypothetical protein
LRLRAGCFTPKFKSEKTPKANSQQLIANKGRSSDSKFSYGAKNFKRRRNAGQIRDLLFILSEMLFYNFSKFAYNKFTVLFVCGKLLKGLEPNIDLLAPVNEYWLDLALEVPALMRGLYIFLFLFGMFEFLCFYLQPLFIVVIFLYDHLSLPDGSIFVTEVSNQQPASSFAAPKFQ